MEQSLHGAFFYVRRAMGGKGQEEVRVHLNRVGSLGYLKASWPVRYGAFHEITTPNYQFQFSPEGVIRFIQGRPGTWHHHADWFKRAPSGEWIYYSSGGYNGAASALGEHYIPIFPYASNGVLGETVFPQKKLDVALKSLFDVVENAVSIERENGTFLRRVARKNTFGSLKRLGELFHEKVGGFQSVLPPDCRHVDYDVVPIPLVEGCLYHCRFCSVKSAKPFRVRPLDEVEQNVFWVKEFLGKDLKNIGGVFLGGHDALAAGPERVVQAAKRCGSLLEARCMKGVPGLFLFSSPDALLKLSWDAWQALSELPFFVQINMGAESLDSKTLAWLGRPTSAETVFAAISRADEVMRRYAGDLSISINMVLGRSLPPRHRSSLHRFVEGRSPLNAPLYLSPLKDRAERKFCRDELVALKRKSGAPVYLYLLQQL
ncbi:MAG: radical SAM protein [Desulfobacterales bacterium]|nr:radical SAM protein [Desulfobacterales bacterium]